MKKLLTTLFISCSFHFIANGQGFCVDSLAINYVPFADTDSQLYEEDLAEFFIVNNDICVYNYGCTDHTAYNYDPSAALNQVSEEDTSDPCVPYILGCDNPNFLEYNPEVNTPNNEISCLTTAVYGCMDSIMWNYNIEANIESDNCIHVVFGCTNSLAFNYDSTANVNDGTCISVIEQLYQSFDAWNASIDLEAGWNMFGYGCPTSMAITEGLSNITEIIIITKDNNGNVYMPEFGFNGIGDFTPGFGYQIKLTESTEDFSLCDLYEIDIPEDNIVSLQDAVTSLSEEISYLYAEIDFMAPYFGCIDSTACNYASSALVDDDGCSYPEIGYNCDGFIKITQANIQQAIDDWFQDSELSSSIYGHISDWDVSNVTDMNGLFSGRVIHESLSSWDVSNVIDMSFLFNVAALNQDLSSWDVSNVIYMNNLFSGVTNFNQDLSSWDVSSVTNMGGMFSNATYFNQDLSSWDVSNVTNMDFMFNMATSFNQDLSSWDVSNVTGMFSMFQHATSFNQDLSSWDVSNVTDMMFMFQNANSFNQDLSSWDVSNVTNMAFMFIDATSFNQDLSSWDVSNVTDIGGMFTGNNLSSENQCVIQTSFSTNPYWPYDWGCPSVEVGDFAWGGIVFYIDETGQHGLVAAMEDLTEGATDPYEWGYDGYEWGCVGEYVDGADATAIGSGLNNTFDIINHGCVTTQGGISAAQATLNAQINGYTDWYLPSKFELLEMFNTIGNGAEENVGAFISWYWSSSEDDNYHSWFMNFNGSGNLNQDDKEETGRVRPIRSF